MNDNAKWQAQSDALLLDCGLTRVVLITQLFASFDANGTLLALVAIVVDEILICSSAAMSDSLVQLINSPFIPGTVTNGPGFIGVFGLNITQRDDHSISVDVDYKRMRIESFPLLCVRRRQQKDFLNAIQTSSFASVNAAFGWIGSTTLPRMLHLPVAFSNALRKPQCMILLHRQKPSIS